ncbi:MAG: methylated-DNA--[protein]-cysteine S-methyltransferase [Candidatus Rokubacteria bacterium]|nr:methylated-DNA--[protein]-cysteine S-methyltransferase [Candidatus Rokubacteria bacterium]
MTEFRRRAWRLIDRIPRGRVATYGQIARLLGRPRHARMVGLSLRGCPPGLPWHRVVNARGEISFRAAVGSMLTQRILLEQEGVALRSGRVSLARYGWQGPGKVSQPRRRHGG